MHQLSVVPEMHPQRAVVHVVEDEASLQRLVSELLTGSGYEVRIYDSADDFLTRYEPRHPQCLLVDVRLPRMSGLELQRRLQEHPEAPPVILTSGVATPDIVARAFRQGAEDFLEKPYVHEALLDAVTKALERDRHEHARDQRRSEAARKLASLTPREREVFDFVVRGVSSKAVAFELGLSKKTVDLHRGNLMRKLDAHSTIELLRLAQTAEGPGPLPAGPGGQGVKPRLQS